MTFSEWKGSWFLEEWYHIQREEESCSFQHLCLWVEKEANVQCCHLEGRTSTYSPLCNLPGGVSQHLLLSISFSASSLPCLFTCGPLGPTVPSWAVFIEYWLLTHKETAFIQSSFLKLSSIPNPIFFMGLWFLKGVVWLFILCSIWFFVCPPPTS